MGKPLPLQEIPMASVPVMAAKQGKEKLMEGWSHRVDAVLNRAPARAMPLSTLVRSLSAEGLAGAGGREWVLQRIQEESEVFRAIPDRIGVWVHWPVPERPGPWSLPGSVPEPDPWILSCTSLQTRVGPEEKAVGRIQETIQAWGRGLDVDSQVAVARWIGATAAAERAVRWVVRTEREEP
jgi:hypothetical protein